MARPSTGGGRVTPSGQGKRQSTHEGRVTESHEYVAPEIAPLYRRKPGMFAFLIIACVAMVMSMMAGIFTVL